ILSCWEDYRDGKQYEIYMQKLSTRGEKLWDESGVRVNTTNGARAPKITLIPNENSFVIVWEDYTDGGKAIYGQKYIVE
ncbi:MAG: hypothetical protein WCV91_04910, partial [Candidatus Margulisiibacteriota bacterium]